MSHLLMMEFVDQVDEVHWVGPVETVAACRQLARGTIFDDAWCSARGLLEPGRSHPVDNTDPSRREVTGWARSRRVRDPLAVR